jgi:hypothetical protein
MTTKYKTTKKELIKKLRFALDRLLSLQGMDRRFNGYLKLRSRERIFAVITNATGVVLDATALVEPKRVNIFEKRVYSKAVLKARQAWIRTYVAKYAASHGAKKLRRAA